MLNMASLCTSQVGKNITQMISSHLVLLVSIRSVVKELGACCAGLKAIFLKSRFQHGLFQFKFFFTSWRSPVAC